MNNLEKETFLSEDVAQSPINLATSLLLFFAARILVNKFEIDKVKLFFYLDIFDSILPKIKYMATVAGLLQKCF